MKTSHMIWLIFTIAILQEICLVCAQSHYNSSMASIHVTTDSSLPEIDTIFVFNTDSSLLKSSICSDSIIPRKAIIQVGSRKARPGELVNIPIYLIGSQNLPIGKIKTSLQYNSSLLYPVDINPSSTSQILSNHITDTLRHLDLQFSSLPTDGNILAYLNCIAAVGNDSVTVLSLSDPIFIGDSLVEIIVLPGSFSIYEFCNEGSPRLINTLSNEFYLKEFKPNPVSTECTVEFALQESGLTRLYLVNEIGRIEVYIVNQQMSPGKYLIKYSFEDIPQGLYYCILQTQTQRLIEKIMIVK